MMYRLFGLVTTVLLVTASAGCSITPNSPDVVENLSGAVIGAVLDTKEGRLAQAEQRWIDNGAPTYDFSLRIGCFCPLPKVVSFQVRGGASFAPGLDTVTRAWVARFESIDALFALLREHLNRNPDRFDVEYDSVLGYPTQADLDASVRARDDELNFEVVEFRLVR